MKTDLQIYKSVHPEDLNCFGTVVLFFNGINRPKWLRVEELGLFLDHNSIKDDSLSKNCIYAMYCPNSNELIHTAVYLGNDQFLHKPGSMEIEIASKQRLHNLYLEDDCVAHFGKKYKIVIYKVKEQLNLALT